MLSKRHRQLNKGKKLIWRQSEKEYPRQQLKIGRSETNEEEGYKRKKQQKKDKREEKKRATTDGAHH